MYGYIGKILHLNLSDSEITTIPTKPYADQYLGARGIASKIYWDTVMPGIDAFSPKNRLIFVTGPLVATGSQGATRMSIVGKSPMTSPEGFCYGNMGGFFPAELKKAGFDGIVVDGRASKPVYLWIHDGKAELRDASRLWGQGAYRAGEMIQETHGKKVRFLTTGAAGENLVRTAVIFGSHQGTSTAGFGAVMGSKNLKALAVKGGGKIPVAEPDKLKELTRYTINLSKRFYTDIMPIIEMTGHAHLVKPIGKGGCHQCGLHCSRNVYRYGNQLEGNRRCQAMEYYLPWRFSRDDEPIETFFDAPTLANDYSICTFELQSLIEWLYVCYESDALSEKETGLPLAMIGTCDFLEKLLHIVAYREGFGDTLAEGMVRVGEKVSPKARALISPRVAPIGLHDLAPPRAIVAHGLIYPMEPRVHQPITHQIGFVLMGWKANQRDPNTSYITTKVVHDIAKAFWGSAEAGDLSSYDGKALAAKKIQNRVYIMDSLGLCDMGWPFSHSFNTKDHVGDPDLEAKTFSAVTGLAYDDFEAYGERIANLQRSILIREGHKVPKDDFPLEFNFTEPLDVNALGGPVIVPGPTEEPMDVTGNTLNRERFHDMLLEYYRLRGWDKETGLPYVDTLKALAQDDLIS